MTTPPLPIKDDRLRRALAARLIDEPLVGELSHPVLAGVSLLLLWPVAPRAVLIVWTSLICLTTLMRALVRKRVGARADRAELESLPTSLRVVIVVVALVWGLGAAYLAPVLPTVHLALLLVVLCGLTAGATSSLVGDPPTYYLYTGALLGPAAIGVVLASDTATNHVALAMIVLFGAGMIIVFQRAHRMLVDYIRAANRLETSEARLFQMLDRLPVGIMVLDPKGQPYLTNATATRILGQGTRPGITGRKLAEVYHAYRAGTDELYPADRMPIVRALAGESSTVDDIEIRRPDGTVNLEVFGSPIYENGEVIFGVAAFNDITERLRDARRTATENAVFHALGENKSEEAVIPDILRVVCESIGCEIGSVFRVDQEGEQLRFVGFWHRPGVDVTEFEALTRGMIFRRGTGFVGRVWSTGEPIWIEELADEREFPRARAAMDAGIRSVIGIPLRDAGRIIGVIEVLSRRRIPADSALIEMLGSVGARVGNALARRRAEAALRETEGEYRQLVEAATDMVWRADTTGRMTFVNAACSDIYGLPPDRIIGRTFFELADSAHRERDRAMIEQALDGADVADYETVHIAASGELRHLNTSARPIHDTSGRIIGVHGIARDVTSRVATSIALRDARDTAEQAAAAKSAFLANMSHEIRTPMNGILGIAELLLDSDLSADDRRSVELIQSSGESLLSLINDVLDYSKIEAHQLDIEEIEFDLPSLVEATARVMSARTRSQPIELVVEIDERVPPFIVGDPTRVRQVLANLLSNAVKFTTEGEVVVSVRAESCGPGRVELRFAVHDTGIGIAAEKLATIFEPFRQADTSTTRKFGGTGLGLAISRRLVDLMGGALTVESQPGRGSTFRFTVPCAISERRPPHETVAVDLHGTRVLLVDDNTTNLRVMRSVLARAGCSVEESRGASEALERLQGAAAAGQPYRVLVSDVLMPGIDGFELTRALRGNQLLRNLPVVLVTSAMRRGDAQRCRELGVSAYLLKPVARQELLDAVSAAVASPLRDRPETVSARSEIVPTPQPRRVLIAEDNLVNQEVAAAMLRRRGHIVDVVSDGAEAVEAVRSREYDAVLMDLQMPRLDGFAATRRIREQRAGKPLPVIAVTANALAGERERCLAAGMDDYLAKPFKAQDLFAAVESRQLAGEREAQHASGDADRHVDLAGFRAELEAGGVADTLPVLLNLFMEDAPGRMSALQDAVRAGDLERVDKAAHAFKSSVGTVRASHFEELLKRTEIAARTNQAADVMAIALEIEREYAAVMRELSEQLVRLHPDRSLGLMIGAEAADGLQPE